MLENVIIFVLASFIGFEVISKVPQTLHTPLMSGTNAISGITIVGALVAAGMVGGMAAKWLGFAALVVALWLAFSALRRIGGQTGDILGATQQLAEVSCLAVLSARV